MTVPQNEGQEKPEEPDNKNSDSRGSGSRGSGR
jgi:hypothetical protein